MDRIVVIGGGVAGLATALRLAPRPVLVLAPQGESRVPATGWAQGGIAAALSADDSPSLHAVDTLKAAAGLGEPEVARRVTAAGPAAIAWLDGLGAPFDRTDGNIVLGLEAAHSRRRIVHAEGDATGRAVLATLRAAAARAPSIAVRTDLSAAALLKDDNGRVAGVLCRTPEGAEVTLAARGVVLASGGVGGLYASTTNPPGAVGSGLALAARAGAVLRDVEFVQFHPTAIVTGADPMPLATEALRGDGATLVNARGERFMLGVPGAELAPRDVVARAIFAEISAGGRVFLDARLPGLERRFPQFVALCAVAGIDAARAPVPVRPAAHYHMGGVEVDMSGRSSLDGLWVCGEAASTGLHGANRLASNSLLEALAFAEWIAEDLDGTTASARGLDAPARAPRPSNHAAEIRRMMDARVGVVRDADSLAGAVTTLAGLAFGDDGAVRDDLALVGLMVAEAALRRSESRGGHFRADFPASAPLALHSRTTLDELAGAVPGAAEPARAVA